VPIGADGIYRSTVIDNFWFDVNWLWQEELPGPLSAFAQIVGPDTVIDFLNQLKQGKPA
jgi:hypothetical protein